MSLFEVLTLIGLPALVAATFRVIHAKIAEKKAAHDALMQGIQALLRAQMISDFNKYSEWGYAPIYARENFENCWHRYHALGANGVMDDLHSKFLSLPTDADEASKKGEFKK